CRLRQLVLADDGVFAKRAAHFAEGDMRVEAKVVDTVEGIEHDLAVPGTWDAVRSPGGAVGDGIGGIGDMMVTLAGLEALFRRKAQGVGGRRRRPDVACHMVHSYVA